MRQKNVLRAAEALFVSQGDDKNKVLASFIDNKDVRNRVKDQGRALLILERLVLPQGKFSYTKEEMHLALLKKLEKRGHRIQADDAEDDEQYAQEKEQFVTERQAMVSDVLGKTVEQVEQEEKRCGNLSPVHGFTCVKEQGHDQSTVQDEFIHESKNHVTWGYGGFAENQEKSPQPWQLPTCGCDDSGLCTCGAQDEPEQELTEEEKKQLEEAHEIQERLLDDLPEVTEVEDSAPTHKDEFGNIVDGIQIQPYPAMTKDELPDFVNIPEIPDVAWQLIGQAYIDGIRTGRSSTE
jgi:hypothetical protein